MSSSQTDLLCYFKQTKNAHKVKSTKKNLDGLNLHNKQILSNIDEVSTGSGPSDIKNNVLEQKSSNEFILSTTFIEPGTRKCNHSKVSSLKRKKKPVELNEDYLSTASSSKFNNVAYRVKESSANKKLRLETVHPCFQNQLNRTSCSLINISEPAYECLKDLAQPTNTGLNLPHKYNLVKEMFRTVDIVVSLLHNRQETITFSKLKPAVKEMLRIAFSLSHLGQLKTVFPLGYFFNQEKVQKMNECGVNVSTYQLTMKPNFDYKLQNINSANASECKFRKMDSVVLVERRRIFHTALLDILIKHQEKFLQKLNCNQNIDDFTKKWHPEFPLEEIELPEPSLLPQPPSKEPPKTAKDIIEEVQGLFSMTNGAKESLKKTATKVNPSSKERIIHAGSKPDIEAALKGVSLALLQKIRARESAKLARKVSRAPASSQKLAMHSRLPELSRILRNIFVTEKRSVLPLEMIANKVSHSYSSMMTTGEAKDHIRLLIKEDPNWCQMREVENISKLMETKKVDKRLLEKKKVV